MLLTKMKSVSIKFSEDFSMAGWSISQNGYKGSSSVGHVCG